MMGISKLNVRAVPVSIVDLETTGLHPAGDRIVEIAVVRIEPGGSPKLVLDTLINPQRRVSATEIHGITDDDVRTAPTFRDLHDQVYDALRGSVFASYNVYFDARFMVAELGRAGVNVFPPHLCLMYLRGVLDLGGRCTLSDACRAHKIPHAATHVAADDALAAAQLWLAYLTRMQKLGINTFAELASGRTYKFIQSFSTPFLNGSVRSINRVGLVPRGPTARGGDVSARRRQPIDRIGEYWDALMAALADLEVTPIETGYLEQKRRELALTQPEVRSLHARAFSGILADVTEDQAIDISEVDRIASMADALRALGWCPGDRSSGSVQSWMKQRNPGFWKRLFG